MSVVHINLDSGDWKETNEPMYYSQEKRSWYCKECDFLTQSPRTAGAHAEEHEIPLPFSRNKIEVELVPVTQHKEAEIPRKEASYETYSEQRNRSHFPSENRTYNDITSPNFVPVTPLDKKIWERLQGRRLVDSMRMTGLFSDEEIEETEIKFGLKQKEEPLKNEGLKKAVIMALQNRYFNEDDEDVQDHILFTMSLIEKEKDPKNIPLLLSMVPRPKPKRNNFSENMLLMMACLYQKRKQKEASILDSPEKLVEIMQMLRKKPSRNQNQTETAIPLTPSDNGLEQNVKP